MQTLGEAEMNLLRKRNFGREIRIGELNQANAVQAFLLKSHALELSSSTKRN